MTLYDYKCVNCENVQEVRHAMTATPEVVCEKCGSTHTNKYLGNANLRVIFRGLGFSVNDSALDKMNVPKAVRENNKNRLFRD